MQIKHTFLFTMMLGIAWCGYLFGYSSGPDPASNGIFGDARACSIPGCHVGNPVNLTGGSVTLTGLPAVWLPGQTYSLLVSVQRPGQTRFGFQLSAVADATNQQAGTLTAGASNVMVITGGGIQYAEHRSANNINSFNVNWTAPSSAGAGTVRFNLAGNAANGDFSNTGDFIYTQVYKVSPESAPPVDNSVRAFTIADRAGVSLITDGSGDLTAGYSRIQPGGQSTTPAGVAIFGLRQNNVVVTEAGVPASPLITAGRIYAEVNGPVNTGLAIANPNDQAAVINFHFTDSAGVDFAAGSTRIEANQQLAKFLNERPFDGGSVIQGTFSFSSSVPVSVIALRGFTNERSEFLITTLPIADLGAAASSSPATLPHFADGGGWTTQIVLVNTTDATETGSIQFYGPGTVDVPAAPITLMTSDGQTASTFSYSIPRQSSRKLVTAGVGSAISTGSVRILPQGTAPTSLVIFSFKSSGITVSEAGVPAILGNAFRMYVETSGTGTTAGNIRSGLAIANSTAGLASVTLELTGLNGASAAPPVTLTVPANGQVAKFVDELFPAVVLPFKGVLRVSGGTTLGLSITGLRARNNERGDFLITTTPPSNEGSAPTVAEMLFPHLVNGGGYTTQFILFSGTTGQNSSGNLRFFKQDGTPFNLNLN